MFHDIPQPMIERMRDLEAIDTRDRVDGTPHYQRLRQVTSETGKFLALQAANAPGGAMLEVGSSAGYSTLWLTRAAKLTNRKITTFEVDKEKVRLALETFQAAGVDTWVDVMEGDARQHLPAYQQVAFIFLDAEKNVYSDCYEIVVPNLVPGGLLLADNVISHRAELEPFLERVLKDERVDAVLVPIGKGVLLCRKL